MLDFPEEEKTVNNFGMKFYGETSYENQMAVLSHFLHNKRKKLTQKEKKEIIIHRGGQDNDWSNDGRSVLREAPSLPAAEITEAEKKNISDLMTRLGL